jgi:hypothetical protein
MVQHSKEYKAANKRGFVSEMLSYVWSDRQQDRFQKPSNPDGVLEVMCEL